MKFALALFLIATSAHACPNLSGEYAFEKSWNGTVTFEQTGCTSVKITYKRPVDKSDANPTGIWTFSETLKTDGLKYEGIYDSLELATPTSYESHTAEFVGDRLMMHEYEGQLTKCGDSYSFTSFECKLFESSFGYDASLQSFTKTQVAQWRGEHDYENDVFLMKKIR